MEIERKRRELFESWAVSHARSIHYSFPEDAVQINGLGDYAIVWVQGAWLGFNAALDAVVIELPKKEECDDGYPSDDWLICNSGSRAIDSCRSAIQSTGLGLKVLP